MPCDITHARRLIYALETDANTKASMIHAFERRMKLFGCDIHFFNEPFTPISLTGVQCALKCKHCNSHYLRHMLDGSNNKFFSYAIDLVNKGANGILLSGGSACDGSVPTYEKADVIQKLKTEKKLKISAHTGIVNGSQAKILSGYLNMALIDVPGDDETIHEILGIDAYISDYENSMIELSSAGIPIAPHIIVGLHNGKLKGEFKALEMVKKIKPTVVVIVVLIPSQDTVMENISPPGIKDVIKVITASREMFETPISLSCVRPGGRYRSMLDEYAILSGIDRIAVPSRNAYNICRELGLNIIEIPKMCCSYVV